MEDPLVTFVMLCCFLPLCFGFLLILARLWQLDMEDYKRGKGGGNNYGAGLLTGIIIADIFDLDIF